MAANNENYIGIAMGLDVTDLKSGLADANKQIQLANSEFKAAASGMDDWTKSTEGITAKVKQLDTVLTLQKKKLSGLQAEYDKVVKSQGENSEAARKLKVQINNQKAVVNATEKELNNYSETLKEAKAGNIDLESATLKSGKALKKQAQAAKESEKSLDGLKSVAGVVAKGILGLGVAAAGLLSGFLSLSESTREVRENFARLDTAFESSGHSAKDAENTYNELYGVLGDTGRATEAAQQLAQMSKDEKDLAANTKILTGVMATYGDSIPTEGLAEGMAATAAMGEVQGVLADALEWQGVNLDEYNAQLATMKTEEERAAFIQSTLTDLYGESADAFKERNKDIIEAREAEAELSRATAELGAIAEPIMTTLKLLAVDLLNAIKPFVELIGEGLKGALEGTAGATDKLVQRLSGLLSSLLEKIVVALPTVISTLLPQVISTITGFLPTLISTLSSQLPVILQAVISGFSQILVEVGKMLPELILIVIDAVLMVVDTLLDNIDQLIDAGISLLMGLADGLIKALPQLIAKIPVIIEKLVGAIYRNAPKLIQSGIELTLKLAVGLIKAIPQLLSNIPQIVSAIVSGFGEAAGEMKKVGLNLLKGIWEGIKSGADWLKDKITGFAGNVADWFKDTFKISSPSKLMADEVGEYIGEGIGVGVLDSIPTVKKQLGKFAGFVQDNLSGIKGGLSVNASGTGGRYASGRGNTVVNAGMTVNYNGTLSRKQLKQLENDNYTAIKMRLRAEGAI